MKDEDITDLFPTWEDILIDKPIKLFDPRDCSSIKWTVQTPTNIGYELFTDGSRIKKSDSYKTGFAFVVRKEGITTQIFSYRLDDHSSIFLAELLAIKHAIEWSITNIKSNCTIFSDSRSALLALESPIQNNNLVESIKSIWKNNITLSWIKAHVGYSGNEEADQCAKEATGFPTIQIRTPFSTTQVKNKLKKLTMDMWSTRWNNSEDGRTTYKIFDTPSTKRLYGDFFLNQILSGHGSFADYQNRFHGRSKECQYCGNFQDIDHLIIRCTYFKDWRKNFFDNCLTTKDWLFKKECNKIAIEIVKQALTDLYPTTNAL